MVNYFDDVIPYCNREITRKCERYMRKHKCSFVEAYNKLYNTNYKHTYLEKLEKLSMDTRPRYEVFDNGFRKSI